MTELKPVRPQPRKRQIVAGVVTAVVMMFVLSIVLPEVFDGSASTFDYVVTGLAVISMIGSVIQVRQVLRG